MKTALHAMLAVLFLAVAGWMIWSALPAPPAPSADPTSRAIPRPEHLDSLDPMVRDLIQQRTSALESSRTDARRWASLGWAYHANGLPELARSCYEQAAAIEPDEGRWPYYLALLRLERGELPQAVTILRRVTELRADFGPAHWRKGLAELQAGDLESAGMSFNVASRIDPESPVPELGLAMIAIRQGRDDEAEAWLQRLLERNRDLPHAKYLLAQCLDRLGRATEAQWWREDGASSQEPVWHDDWEYKLVDARTGHAHVTATAASSLAAGRFKSAIDRLERALPYWPSDAGLLVMLSQAYLHSGRYEDVVKVTEQSAQATATEAPAAALWLARGRALARLDRTAEAAQALEQAAALPAATGDVFLYLAQVRLQLHDRHAAAQALQQARDRGSLDPELLKQVEHALAAAPAQP